MFHAHDFEKALVIFTDGSSLGNPGSGGYGSVVVFPQLDEIIELGGNKTHTTNNEMELSAVIAALSYTYANTAETHIFTDSSYVISGITQWVFGWQKNNWKTKTGGDVANQSLWKNLAQLVREREQHARIHWHHVPGHVGVVGNERCDTIATSYAQGKPSSLYRGKLSSYPYAVLDISFPSENLTEKKEGRTRSQTKAFSYLSLLDGVVMRHDTWASCEARVKGTPARFKKALSAADEKSICESWGVLVP